MSTQVRITIEGCKTVVSGIGDGTGGLHVEGPLSSTPESVKDAGGTSSGLSLTAAPHAVHVTTAFKVEGASTLSGGATVTGGLTVDTIKPTADRVAVTGELTVSTTGGALKVGTNLEGTKNALTVAGGASVTGGLAVDALKVTKRLIADSATINDELTVGSASLPAGSNILTVTGGTTVSGALTLSGTNLPAGTTVGLAVTAGATVSGALTVGTSLPAGTTVGLAVTGGATISSALTVGTSSQAGTNALTVAGGASVTGGLAADSATVSGANVPVGNFALTVAGGAWVTGGLTADTLTISQASGEGGSVRMLNCTQPLTPAASGSTSYDVNTDGFVIGIVAGTAAGGCIEIETGGVNISAYPGLSFLLPIPNGSILTITPATSGPSTSFYFMQIGSMSTATAITLNT